MLPNAIIHEQITPIFLYMLYKHWALQQTHRDSWRCKSYVVARINCTNSPVLKYFIVFIFHYLLCSLDFCRCLFGNLDNVVVAGRRTCIKCNISFLLLLDTISFLANNSINFMHNLNRDKSRSIFYFLHLLIFPFMFVRNVATYAMLYNCFWLNHILPNLCAPFKRSKELRLDISRRRIIKCQYYVYYIYCKYYMPH